MEQADIVERQLHRIEYDHRCLSCGGDVEAISRDGEYRIRCDAPQEIGPRGCGWQGTVEN